MRQQVSVKSATLDNLKGPGDCVLGFNSHHHGTSGPARVYYRTRLGAGRCLQTARTVKPFSPTRILKSHEPLPVSAMEEDVEAQVRCPVLLFNMVHVGDAARNLDIMILHNSLDT